MILLDCWQASLFSLLAHSMSDLLIIYEVSKAVFTCDAKVNFSQADDRCLKRDKTRGNVSQLASETSLHSLLLLSASLSAPVFSTLSLYGLGDSCQMLSHVAKFVSPLGLKGHLHLTMEMEQNK